MFGSSNRTAELHGRSLQCHTDILLAETSCKTTIGPAESAMEPASINPIGIDPSGGGCGVDDPASASRVITGPTMSTAALPDDGPTVVAAAAAVVAAASSEQKLVLSHMSQFLLACEDSVEFRERSSHFLFEARCIKATHSAPGIVRSITRSADVRTCIYMHR